MAIKERVEVSSKKTFSEVKRLVTNPRMLWMTGIAYLCITVLFAVVMAVWDFVLIDEMYISEAILSHIDALSDLQKRVHIITTATLDVAYPLAYGFFQAGMAYRYLGALGKWVAPLSLICIPVDLLEGYTQVMLLAGNTDYIALKTVLTPIKFGLFVPGFIFAVIALLIAYKRSRAN